MHDKDFLEVLEIGQLSSFTVHNCILSNVYELLQYLQDSSIENHLILHQGSSSTFYEEVGAALENTLGGSNRRGGGETSWVPGTGPGWGGVRLSLAAGGGPGGWGSIPTVVVAQEPAVTELHRTAQARARGPGRV